MTVTELERPRRPLSMFYTEVAVEGTSAVLRLQGEADVFTLPAVVGGLAGVISEHDGPVIVDLSDTSFIDIATLRALGRAAQFLARRDRTLTVRGPSLTASRLLAFVGLSQLIETDRTPQHERRPGCCCEAVTTTERRDPCTSESEPSC